MVGELEGENNCTAINNYLITKLGGNEVISVHMQRTKLIQKKIGCLVFINNIPSMSLWIFLVKNANTS